MAGDETALAVLRSKKETIGPEKATTGGKDYEQLQAARDKHAAKVKQVEDSTKLSTNSKRALLSVFRMQRLADEDVSSPVRGFRHTIDTKGIVIFTLPSGAVIRDEGREILFSGRNEEAKKIAEQYAKLKWGKNIEFARNILTRSQRQKKTEINR